MEAENNQNTAPDFETQIDDTRAQREAIPDRSFDKAIGLPPPPAVQVQEERARRVQELEQQQGQTQQPEPNFSQQEVAPEGNDQVRYQYWQSQAAQMKNQLDQVKEYMPMVDYLRNNPEAVQNLTPGSQGPEGAAPPSQEAEEFPPPPERPEQPAGYSREEALSDPTSDSAKYLDAQDKWKEDMITYNGLANQYQVAMMREEYNRKIEGLEKVELERKQARENYNEMQNVRSFVQQKYNLGDNLDDFINTMNDPGSINMDDLVGYYQYKKGVAPQQPQPMQQRQPSAAFRQTQRAQSVPRPMGVQSSQNPNTAQSGSSDFMSAIIGQDNKNIL